MRILFLTRSSHGIHPGGDSIHLEQTAAFLRKQGHEVVLGPLHGVDWRAFDLVHLFNLTKPMTVLKNLGKPGFPPIVCSAIFIDPRVGLRFNRPWQRGVLRLIDPEGWTYLRHLYHWIRGQEKAYSWQYILEGQRASVQKLLQHLSCLITASEAERALIEAQYQVSCASRVIPLGTEHLPCVKDELSHPQGVVYVARFEPLKNQLALIQACRDLELELTLVGTASRNHQKYYRQCMALAGDRVHFTGALEPGQVSQVLQSAQVHLSASWYESTGLNSIEALASGCTIGVINHPIQRELFGHRAVYHSGTVHSLRQCLQKALASSEDHSTWARKHFSWEKAAVKLSAIYRSILKEPAL